MQEKKIKPVSVLAFIVSVLVVLLIVAWIFPKEDIKITEDISLKFISVKQIFNPKKQQTADITELLKNTDIETTEENSTAFVEAPKPKLDSAIIDSQVIYYKPRKIRIDSVVQFLEFPKGQKDILHAVYETMAELKNTGKLLRIMHYGDSQIEQDRITNYFRFKMQQQFGGYGPGMVPAVKSFNFELPMSQESTGDWKRYTAFGRKDTTVKHDRYGVMATFARFAPIEPDTSFRLSETELITPAQTYKASLSFSKSRFAYSNTKKYSRCRMFLGNIKKELNITVKSEEKTIEKKVIAPKEGLHTIAFHFNPAPQKLTFEFESIDSPEFYGFSFDTHKGIIVDNVAMRGSSGLMFTRMDLNLSAKIHRILGTKLLILQFGGNVVPMHKENYDFYARSFSYRLRTLKKIIPGVQIIVIGPSDMSKKEDDLYITQPEVPLIRDALKKAAFDNNCAFWDMYSAMGGKNSMPGWVFNDPPLGEKDFIHFTPKGAKYIAKLFYNAFIYDYNAYISKRK
ncbi:MAG: hypothetical protein U9N85_04150 [Bacteroidota bacterium]|nr:hypothetical protein [Bacteroidota bacterium]